MHVACPELNFETPCGQTETHNELMLIKRGSPYPHDGDMSAQQKVRKVLPNRIFIQIHSLKKPEFEHFSGDFSASLSAFLMGLGILFSHEYRSGDG